MLERKIQLEPNLIMFICTFDNPEWNRQDTATDIQVTVLSNIGHHPHSLPWVLKFKCVSKSLKEKDHYNLTW